MLYDDLPIWAFIGRVEDEHYNGGITNRYQLFTHIEFEIFYNKEHVIEINLRTHPNSVVDVTEDKEVDVEFMYTVRWSKTEDLFERRTDKYLSVSSLPHHCFSVMNSFLTVLFILGCLMMFYDRVLKKDINKYANEEELGDNREERGWKSIHGDVFRYPNHKSLFTAAIGSSTQLFIISISIIVLGVFGVLQPYSRGTLFTSLVLVYVITSVIAGYTAVSLYCQLERDQLGKEHTANKMCFWRATLPYFLLLKYCRYHIQSEHSPSTMDNFIIVFYMAVWSIVIAFVRWNCWEK